jgi:translation elongation factor EF-Tu-like GTPase
VTSESADERFLLTVVDVLDISGRGASVVGPIESGVVRTDDRVRWLGEMR